MVEAFKNQILDINKTAILFFALSKRMPIY